eukprot:scaffold65059_cov65-Phaeocystis_antarctica.AAC.6
MSSCTRCILPIPGPLWPPGGAVVAYGAARWHMQQPSFGGRRANALFSEFKAGRAARCAHVRCSMQHAYAMCMYLSRKCLAWRAMPE